MFGNIGGYNQMENKKFNFNEVTVRFDDLERSKLFSETFARCENKFASSKSAFIGYLAFIGLQEFVRELDGESRDEEDLSDYEKISEAIDALIMYL
jgi:hypothetical protein